MLQRPLQHTQWFLRTDSLRNATSSGVGLFQSIEVAEHICCVRAEWLKTCGGYSSLPDLPCRLCHKLRPMAYS